MLLVGCAAALCSSTVWRCAQALFAPMRLVYKVLGTEGMEAVQGVVDWVAHKTVKVSEPSSTTDFAEGFFHMAPSGPAAVVRLPFMCMS
jgi:hypothetical protein